MAVEFKYVDADLEAGKKGSALFAYGTETTTVRAVASVAAADDNGSKYVLFAGVPASYVPVSIVVRNTAITGGTDYDLGLYKQNKGAVVDADVLADGISVAGARAADATNNVGMTTVGLADFGKTLGELSGQTDVDGAYDVVLTANTVGTAAGTIEVTATFAYK